MSEDYLSAGQAARLLGLSRERIVQLANAGRLPHVRTPLGRLFLRADVVAYAKERNR